MADSMQTEVPVKLSDEELLERGESLAQKMLHIETLRDKKKADAKRTQGLIDEELEEAARLARVITGQEEARKQGELFVGDLVATDALAQVAEAACTCEPAPCECQVFVDSGNDDPPARCECSHTDVEHSKDGTCEAKDEGVHKVNCPVHGTLVAQAEAPTPIDGSALAADPGPDGNPEDKATPFPTSAPDGDAA